MENLRWILILSGVAILAVLYFSGKPRRSRDAASVNARRSNSDSDEFMDPLMGGDSHRDGSFKDDTLHDRTFNEESFNDTSFNDTSFRDDPVEGFDSVESEDVVRSAQSSQHEADNLAAELDNYVPEEPYFEEEPAQRRDASAGFSSFAQKIEAISERLTPKRRQRIAAFEPADIEEMASVEAQPVSKIVTLHVVAPQNTLLNGGQLLDVFDRRGYHYGDMNIFHSMHKGETVFSIAKMVEPGSFDVEDLDSFITPGVTLILQLPGPVAADVAFEVLISEAYEMAGELNAIVLDGDRNNLSKQTLQHMRESIYEYMHRQKYFSKVPS